jgi:uncharacterized membrane protein YqaE (UPF0057 family)
MDILEVIFKPIIDPLKSMIIAIVGIAELILEIIKLLPKLVELITNIFTPDKLINDIIYGVITGFTTMINAIMNNITNVFSDQNKTTTSNTDGIYSDNVPKTCIKPTIINLIILVLCPPLAILISKGIQGILLILICSILTYYMYYFPGLLFAALHTLC